MAVRKPSNKIWYHNGTAYKTEETFLKNCRRNSNVAIYEMVDYHQNATEYKENLISQRERDEQLSIILDENSESSKVLKFKKELANLKPDNYYTRKIVSTLEKSGLNNKIFKRILNSISYKRFLLYDVSHEQNWYEILLDIQLFRLTKSIPKDSEDIIRRNFSNALKSINLKNKISGRD